jgi:hypothetical protein
MFAFFIVSSILVATSCLLGYLCVSISFLIVFVQPEFVLYINSMIQLMIGILLTSACVIYPLGWSDSRIKDVCYSDKFKAGICEIKWTLVSNLFFFCLQIIFKLN